MTQDTILGRYINDLRKIPLLSREEEAELARKAAKGDKRATDKLITANLRFVIRVARDYTGQGLELEDLVSEGNMGLLDAVKRFDCERGVRLITYAVYWIRQSISRAVSERSGAIRLPMNKINELNTLKKEEEENSKYGSEEKVSEKTEENERNLHALLNASKSSISLDSKINSASECRVKDYIRDTKNVTPEESALLSAMKSELDAALSSLKARDKEILRMRYALSGGREMSLREVGNKMSLSKERVRQLEAQAFSFIKRSSRAESLYSFVA